MLITTFNQSFFVENNVTAINLTDVNITNLILKTFRHAPRGHALQDDAQEILQQYYGGNASGVGGASSDETILYPIEWVIPITVLYGIIFALGLMGNVSTCIVIARNKSLHTVTNYYLFSIAVSDLLLLISGLPPEMYRIWSPEKYVFGETFCILHGFAAETSANATVLTITAFTVERYLAICHPFLSHTMSNLSRAIKYILAIWLAALCLAVPQAIQFGVQYEMKNGVELSRCTIVANDFFQHAFEISTFLIFVGPMTLITVLYILIAIKLGKSRILKRPSLVSCAASNNSDVGLSRASRKAAAQSRVIKMLVAVVVAFFICWAPFHAQRLLAVYLSSASEEDQQMCIDIYIALMYISGVLYFLSTSVNPVLYHIMSNKFRQAFKNTFYGLCNKDGDDYEVRARRTYSVLSRFPPSQSLRNYQRSISDGVQHCQEIPLKEAEYRTTTPASSALRPSLSAGDNCIRQPQQRTRVHSQSSATTVLTTVSRTSSEASTQSRKNNNYNPNLMTLSEKNEHSSSSGNAPLNGNGARNYLIRLFMLLSNKSGAAAAAASATAGGESFLDKATTISNSSLRDFDDIEFSSSDLVKFMEEVNEDLSTA